MRKQNGILRFSILFFIMILLMTGCQNAPNNNQSPSEETLNTNAPDTSLDTNSKLSALENEPFDDMHQTLESTLAQAQSTYLTKEDLSYYSLDLLAFLQNEMMAAHGYTFESPLYQTYFESQDWYTKNEAYKESDLNEFERYNLLLIAEVQADLQKTFSHEDAFDPDQLPNTLSLRQVLGPYLIDQSQETRLNIADLRSFIGSEDLAYAAYEIEARHGKIFDEESVQNYFEGHSWYHANQDYHKDALSDVEVYNLNLIQDIQSQVNNYSDVLSSQSDKSQLSNTLEEGPYYVKNIEINDQNEMTFTSYTQYYTIWPYPFEGKDYLDHNCPVLVVEKGLIKRVPIQEVTNRLQPDIDKATWAERLNQALPYDIQGLESNDSQPITLKVSQTCDLDFSVKALKAIGLNPSDYTRHDSVMANRAILIDGLERLSQQNDHLILLDVDHQQIVSISVN